MRDLAQSGLPSLLLFTTKTHIEGIAFGIFPDRFSARYWLLDILLYT